MSGHFLTTRQLNELRESSDMAALPLYSISAYTDTLFRVVKFNRGLSDDERVFIRDPNLFEHTGQKLDPAFSRARSLVLQYALCNPWSYFFTGTLDPNKFDRYNLDSFLIRFTQFIRDCRKKYNAAFHYLLVPEKHKDGAWHVHGLLAGIPSGVLCPFDSNAPYSLRIGNFLNWPSYSSRFGFCSLALIKKPISCAFYITKYVGKGIQDRSSDVGKRLYFHSRPLATAEKVSDVYASDLVLDDICVNHYDFVSSGFAFKNWDFPYTLQGSDYRVYDLVPMPASSVPDIKSNELIPDFLQERLEGF